MGDGLIFNDIHCDTLSLELLDQDRPLLAESKAQFVDIAQRDGSIFIPDDSRKDITVSATFFINPVSNKTFHDRCRDIAEWLSTNGKKRLIFDDDPDYYYNAIVVSEISRERVAEYGQFTVEFRCDPIQGSV